jgi:hypothetical protein
MNERITQLAVQAGFYANPDIEKFEKFAELIVRECAGVGYDASYYECALNVSNKIKEHFGVEE